MSSYEETYQRWVMSLPKSKQAKLKKLGLDKPLNDQGKLNTPNNADVVFANLGTDFDYDASSSRIFDTPAICMDEDENAETDVESADDKAKAYGSLLLTWVLQRLQTQKSANIHLELECLAFALGDVGLLSRDTQSNIAKRYKMTKANVSFKVKQWQKLVGVNPSSLMKSKLACKAYKKIKMQQKTENLTRNV